jgi:hypothetical protein
MAFTKNTGVKLFPLKWIKDCIKIYTKRHGKAPKILAVNQDDFIDYCMSQTIGFYGLPLAMSSSVSNKFTESLGLDMIIARKDLKEGEIEFGTGFSNPA